MNEVQSSSGSHRAAASAAASGLAAAAVAGKLDFSTANPARLVLVDDHAILREGLTALTEIEGDLKVVGHAGTIADGIAVAMNVRPDLIITDLSLPGSTGLQGIVEFRQRCPDSRVMVLTMHDSEEYIRAALSAGAQGYVLKDATRAELIHGVRAVLAGQRHLCPRSSARVVRSYLGEQAPLPPMATGVTGREREILGMIARGQSNKRIARELGRSVKTVEKHRANLMRKLHLHNVADMTRFAMQSGMMGPDVGEQAHYTGTDDHDDDSGAASR
jgi:DNA-binding NarL/FixJ family response regulator